MTFKRPAYEEINIAHGGNTVTLRPSLRAATILEDKFGLAAIAKGLAEFNLNIVSEIIRAASCNASDAAAFLSSHPERPLSSFFAAVIIPLHELIDMFVPAPVQRLDTPMPTPGEPVSFADMFASLYAAATGWLEWSPEQAWAATPTEIDRAFMAHDKKLKLLYGSGEADPSHSHATDPEQAKRNLAAGLDPEFDRNALHAMKAKIAGSRV